MTPKAATEKKFVVSKDSKYNSAALQKQADEAMREMDRVIRWKKIHALLRKTNKKARKEQDVTAEDAKFFRDNGLVKKEKTEAMGLRWGVALPPLTYQALIQSDLVIDGRSDLQHPDKEGSLDLKGTNQIVKDLEKAFPQYRVS